MQSNREPDWHELFMGAALEPSTWLDSLAIMADSMGAAHGQLIGVGPDRDAAFNLVTNFDLEAFREYADLGGSLPSLNFRIAASQQEIRRGNYDPIVYEKHYEAVIPQLASRRYVDWCDAVDIPYGCQSNLVIDGNGIIGLAALRGRREGQTSREDRLVFARATEGARRAVRLQERLEGQQAQLLAGAFEAIGICAFLIDRQGKLMAHTERAEELLTGGLLKLRSGMLFADTQPVGLRTAVDSLMARDSGLPHIRLQIRLPDAHPPLIIEGFRLPQREWSFGRLPCAVLVGNPPRGDRAGVTTFLITLYRLTAAEADIAMRLLDGGSRTQIAADRGVTTATLKGQLKTLYQKCRVDGEAALVRLLSGIAA